METLFPKRHGLGMPISFQADGSLDRGLLDKQAMLLSCIGKSGFKETYFLDLRDSELDMTKSKDGRSPDAAATAHCYVAALDELNESLGQFLPQGNWRDALVNFSFDNCSVNMGDKQGTEHTVFAPARASGPPFKAPAPFRAPTPPGPPSTLPDPPPSPSAKCTQATFPCILALY